MSFEQFLESVQKKNQWKFLIDISIAVLVVVAGLVMFYKLYSTDWFEHAKSISTSSSKPILYAFSVGLTILGIWALKKVKQDYQVLTITTHRDKNENDKLVAQVAHRLNWALKEKNLMMEYLGNSNSVFGYGYDIRVLTADKYVHVDIQSIGAGVIDFGDKTRLVKKIKCEIAACLQQCI